MKILEDVQREIELIKKEKESMLYVADDPERYNELCNKINRLLEIQQVLSCPKVASSDELDIYAELKGINYTIYHLTLHEEVEPIGYVRVSYDDGQSSFGNIGYSIWPRYRGHNFTIKALEMLEDIMIEKKLTKPIITANPQNIASIRIIEKFGGELVRGAQIGAPYNYYQVDLLKKKDKPKKAMSKHL